HDPKGVRRWFRTENLDQIWAGAAASDKYTAGRGWRRHVEQACQLALGHSTDKLGSPPQDLVHILALQAIAGPGVVALRTLDRLVPGGTTGLKDYRRFAAPLAHSFLHLFNLPEGMSLLRDPEK